jgi:hypothetical protein
MAHSKMFFRFNVIKFRLSAFKHEQPFYIMVDAIIVLENELKRFFRYPSITSFIKYEMIANSRYFQIGRTEKVPPLIFFQQLDIGEIPYIIAGHKINNMH